MKNLIDENVRRTDMKYCPKCKLTKGRFEFYVRNASPDKMGGTCKACDDQRHRDFIAQNRELVREKRKDYRRRNKKHIQMVKRLSRFGMPIIEQVALLKKQRNRCAICYTHSSKLWRHLALDHDHKNGINRGFLCDTCNRSLGLLKDSVDILKSAIKYLRKYQKQR